MFGEFETFKIKSISSNENTSALRDVVVGQRASAAALLLVEQIIPNG